MATSIQGEKQYIDAFFKLTLRPTAAADLFPWLSSLTSEQRKDFVDLADSNHVVIRVFEVINRVAGHKGNADVQAWAVSVLTTERERIANALTHLKDVCEALQEADCPAVVMKTLDHWPDLGNDLDLVTTGPKNEVVRVFTQKLNAHVEARSWGDRLANKWNFALPGLRESVEAHIGRLGQTGEHKEMAQRFIDRRVNTQVHGYEFPTPAPEERIFAATLQRMYRHFYFRVCDILNAASLVESGKVKWEELRRAAEEAGIWPGVASFLNIVSEYVKQYRGSGLNLPADVLANAALGADQMYTRARFLRIPILPYGARLYTRQITHTACKGNVPATFRLSLLPPLASAAAVAFKITGSDKGVW
ncbi:MAG: hypothetical protein DMG65_00510 [Candidatus Angelobacter sp. Gp1-AA117]|nr:MAG: hypothetical protein DMG65_00510 [Candidatus Angelobacter sp. Gp1-AA117]